MKGLFTTFGLTFGLLFLALMGFLISWLVKGETFKGGSCGRRPKNPKDKSCGTDISCVLCNPSGEKKQASALANNDQDDINDDSTH